MLLQLSFFLCLQVNALNAELDSVRKQLNEKADEINRLSHKREKHRNGLENILHEIKSKYCAVCKVGGSTPLLTFSGCIWFNLDFIFIIEGVYCIWDVCPCYKGFTYISINLVENLLVVKV